MGVVGGLLDAGRGIEVAARRFDLFGDSPGGTPPRALEGHMFQQVGETLLVDSLVTRSGADPNADGGRLEVRHPIRDDAQSRREGGDLQAHDAVFRPRAPSTRSRMKRSTAA